MKKLIKGISLLTSTIIPLITSSCSLNNNFFLANFESYINSNLLENLENNQYSSILNLNDKETQVNITNLNYRTYSTNEDLERNFSTNYDVAIPSTYLIAKLANKNQLHLIDWSKFNLYKLDKNGIQTNQKITNSEDALSLFTPQVRAILLPYNLDEAYAKDNITKDNPNYNGGLLNYCVPYFLQDVKFVHKLKNNTDNLFNATPYTWNNLFKKIKEGIQNKSITKISSVNDYRTLYSISRLIETDDQTVNPEISNNNLSTFTNTINISDYEKSFKYLVDDFPKNTYYLNSDSNNVLNSFSQLNGPDSIMSYNGDILYSVQGGDNYSYDSSNYNLFKYWIQNFLDEDNILIKNIETNNSLFLLDCMVINKNRVNNSSKLNQAYAVIKKIALEGIDHSLYSNQNKTEYNKNTNQNDSPIFQKENNDYVYGPMKNFSYVQYTSPSLTLNAYILNSDADVSKYNTENYIGVENTTSSNLNNFGAIYDSLSTHLQGEGFYTNIYDKYSMINSNIFSNETQYNKFIDLLLSIYHITKKININSVQTNISDLNKSNMSWAFSDVQSKYF